jgi:uncharacterized protein YegL
MALTDKVEIARRTMVLFFIVDASGSMDGAKIGAVNQAILEVIPEIREINDENADAQIKIAVMEFSAGATWITKGGPVEVDQFQWKDIQASGVTDLGTACRELNKKLSKKEFMQDATGSFAPAIFLLSDGDPTDDFESGLEELKQNNWFKAAVKAAVAIGDAANKEVLAKFTGHEEAVIEAHNVATLKKMIKFVSVTSSQIASRSSNVTSDPGAGAPGIEDEAKEQAVIDAMKEITAETQQSDTEEEW